MAEGYDNINLIPHNFEKVGDKWTTWTTYPTEETILSYTIPESGLYLLNVQFTFNANSISTYAHSFSIRLRGGGLISKFQVQASSENLRTPVSYNSIIKLNANQIIDVNCIDENPTPITIRLIDENATSSSYAIKLK